MKSGSTASTLHINSSALCNTCPCITVGEAARSQISVLFAAKSIPTPCLSPHVKCLQQFRWMWWFLAAGFTIPCPINGFFGQWVPRSISQVYLSAQVWWWCGYIKGEGFLLLPWWFFSPSPSLRGGDSDRRCPGSRNRRQRLCHSLWRARHHSQDSSHQQVSVWREISIFGACPSGTVKAFWWNIISCWRMWRE